MLENCSIDLRPKARGWRAALFPLSVTVHAVVIALFLVASLWSTDFPRSAPAQTIMFQPTAAPPPPPPPPRPSEPVAEQPQPRPTPAAESAPATIPDVIPTLEPPPSRGAGNRDGVPGGVDQGTTGGVVTEAAPITVETPPQVDRVMQAGGEVKRPVKLSGPAPDYPPLARRTGLTGRVVVECIIERDGRVRDVRVVRSSNPIFEEASLRAVRQWRFTPGVFHGRTVPTVFQLTVQFDLRR